MVVQLQSKNLKAGQWYLPADSDFEKGEIAKLVLHGVLTSSLCRKHMTHPYFFTIFNSVKPKQVNNKNPYSHTGGLAKAFSAT